MYEKIEALMVALEASKQDVVQESHRLSVTNLLEFYKDGFTDTSKALMSLPKAKKLDGVVFFGGRAVGAHNIPKVIDELSKVINYHAALGHITHFLYDLGSIELVVTDWRAEHPEYVVFCWPVMTKEGQEAVKAANYDITYTDDGQLPKLCFKDPIKSISGELSHTMEISLVSLMNVNTPDVETMIEDRKQLLLSLLPVGTVFVKSITMPVFSTCRNIVLVFNHPYFKTDTTIVLDQQIIIWPKDGDAGLEQSHIITGIRYIGPDGQPLFPSFS